MRSHKLVALTYTTNLLTWHYQWTIFVVFSLVMASCGFSDCCHSWHRCQNRNVVKCQNSEITDVFCSVYEFWQFYIWVFNLITQILVNFQIFASILRSSFFPRWSSRLRFLRKNPFSSLVPVFFLWILINNFFFIHRSGGNYPQLSPTLRWIIIVLVYTTQVE